MSSTSFWKSPRMLTGFVLGAIVVVFLFHAYMVYQTRALALNNRATLNEITTFLNQAVGGNSQAGPVTDTGAGEPAVNFEEGE